MTCRATDHTDDTDGAYEIASTTSYLINSANERQRVSHASGAGRRGPRERACKGVRGTKPPDETSADEIEPSREETLRTALPPAGVGRSGGASHRSPFDRSFSRNRPGAWGPDRTPGAQGCSPDGRRARSRHGGSAQAEAAVERVARRARLPRFQPFPSPAASSFGSRVICPTTSRPPSCSSCCARAGKASLSPTRP